MKFLSSWVNGISQKWRKLRTTWMNADPRNSKVGDMPARMDDAHAPSVSQTSARLPRGRNCSENAHARTPHHGAEPSTREARAKDGLEPTQCQCHLSAFSEEMARAGVLKHKSLVDSTSQCTSCG